MGVTRAPRLEIHLRTDGPTGDLGDDDQRFSERIDMRGAEEILSMIALSFRRNKVLFPEVFFPARRQSILEKGSYSYIENP
jgi:hypothetical protein